MDNYNELINDLLEAYPERNEYGLLLDKKIMTCALRARYPEKQISEIYDLYDSLVREYVGIDGYNVRPNYWESVFNKNRFTNYDEAPNYHAYGFGRDLTYIRIPLIHQQQLAAIMREANNRFGRMCLGKVYIIGRSPSDWAIKQAVIKGHNTKKEVVRRFLYGVIQSKASFTFDIANCMEDPTILSKKLPKIFPYGSSRRVHTNMFWEDKRDVYAMLAGEVDIPSEYKNFITNRDDGIW